MFIRDCELDSVLDMLEGRNKVSPLQRYQSEPGTRWGTVIMIPNQSSLSCCKIEGMVEEFQAGTLCSLCQQFSTFARETTG